MPNLAFGDVLLYTMRYEFLGQTYLNTFHLEYHDNSGAVDDYTVFATAYLTQAEAVNQLVDDLRDATVDLLNFTDHRLQRIRSTRLAPIVSPLNLAGTVAGDALPGNAAMTLTKRGEVAARYGIGSWHQPGLPFASLDDPLTFGAATINTMNSALNNWFNIARTPPAMNGNVVPVLWNASAPLRKTRIFTIGAQPSVRVMRRRTKGVGI